MSGDWPGVRSPRWHWWQGFLSGAGFGAACIAWGEKPWGLVVATFVLSALLAALWVGEGLLRYKIGVLQGTITAAPPETEGTRDA